MHLALLQQSIAQAIGHTTYIAIAALIINLAVAAVLTLVFRKIGLQDGYDETRPADYLADAVTVPAAAPGREAPGFVRTR